mmetsp:Transcript_2201/g.6109  ORF Transcript_2201/g.6109 Transcript_2201/m.6109 type:complete len:215 (+) Transcript_2201:1290-1934(+)
MRVAPPTVEREDSTSAFVGGSRITSLFAACMHEHGAVTAWQSLLRAAANRADQSRYNSECKQRTLLCSMYANGAAQHRTTYVCMMDKQSCSSQYSYTIYNPSVCLRRGLKAHQQQTTSQPGDLIQGRLLCTAMRAGEEELDRAECGVHRKRTSRSNPADTVEQHAKANGVWLRREREREREVVATVGGRRELVCSIGNLLFVSNVIVVVLNSLL